MIARGGFSHSRSCTSGVWGRANAISTALSCAVAANECRRKGAVEVIEVDKTPAYRDASIGAIFDAREIRRGLYLAEIEQAYEFLGIRFDAEAWKNASPPPGWEPKGSGK
jgi:hypothetical protein